MASILVLSATNLSCTQPVGVGGIRWHLANLFAGGASLHDHSAPSRWAGDCARPQVKRDEQGLALLPGRLPPVIPGQSRSFHSFALAMAGYCARPQLKRDEQGFALLPARLPPVIPGEGRSFHSFALAVAGYYARPQIKRDEQGFALLPAGLAPVIPGQSRWFHSFCAEAGIRRQTPAASRPMSRMSDAVRRAARWLRSLECLSMEDARVVRPRTIRAKGVTMQRAGSEYRGVGALFPGWRAIHGGVRFLRRSMEVLWRVEWTGEAPSRGRMGYGFRPVRQGRPVNAAPRVRRRFLSEPVRIPRQQCPLAD